jgi:hypothetical protein
VVLIPGKDTGIGKVILAGKFEKSFFISKDINWDDVFGKRLKPPFVPNVSGPDDVSNFDSR